MKLQRLLIVGPLPPPIGGVETVTQAVLESTAFAKYNVRHCNTTKGRPKQTQGRFDLGNYWWALRHFGRMWRAVRSFKPNIVYMPVASSWSGFLRDSVLATIASRSGARVVGHVHGGRFDQILSRTGRDGQRVARAMRRYDSLLVLGTRWKQVLEDYGYHGQSFIVPSTLRQETYDRGLQFKRTHRQEGRIRGLFVGQVGKRKGTFDILPALSHLKESGMEFEMTFVGPPEYEGEWELAMRMKSELGLDQNVNFTGSLQGEPLYEEFRRGEIFIMPSYAEGLPVVFFECGAFEMPAITSPVGAIPDLIEHGRNGLLVEPGDVEAIGDAIKKLATDHEERERMAIEMKQDIQKYHPEKVTYQISQAIEATINST